MNSAPVGALHASKSGGRARPLLGGIVLLALALRLSYVTLMPQAPIMWDQNSFCRAGQYIGGVGTDETSWKFNAEMKGPLYPLFLGALFRAFPSSGPPGNIWIVRIVQALLGALTCIPIFLVGRRVGGVRMAAIAALLAAVHPNLIVYCGHLLSEILAIFLLMTGLALVHAALDAAAWRRWLLAGTVIGLALLSRVTFLTVVPVLLIAPLLASATPWLRRIAHVAVFGTALLVLPITWSAGARWLGMNSYVGSGGGSFFMQTLKDATDSRFTGWHSDRARDKAFEAPAGGGDDSGAYRLAALTSLAFVHLWYPETRWLGFYYVPDFVLATPQRLLLLLAFGGAGLLIAGVSRGWLLPLVACGLAGALLLWIELRHVLPLLPILFLMAAALIERTAEWLYGPEATGRTRALVFAGVMLAVLGWFGSEMRVLGMVFPTIHPYVLGIASDAVYAISVIAIGAIVSVLTWRWMACGRALVTGLIPALAFAGMYACYASVGSDPRWRAWRTDLMLPVEQVIEFRAPLRLREVESAYWLIDLQSESKTSMVSVTLNERRMELAGAGALMPQSTIADNRVPGALNWQKSYIDMAFLKPVESNPQYWVIKADPEQICGQRRLTLRVAADAGRLLAERLPGVTVGGSFRDREGARYQPSIASASIYRWCVLGDWRMWVRSDASDAANSSRFGSAMSAETVYPGETISVYDVLARMPGKNYIQECLARHQADFNIRLRVRFRDGRERLY